MIRKRKEEKKNIAKIICETELVKVNKNFDFSKFKKESKLNIEDKWLQWFVGFYEGDGCLYHRESGFNFSIAQDEIYILEHIKDTLGGWSSN